MYASSTPRNRPWIASNIEAARCISAFIIPAILESRTSRDSSVASACASAAERILPSRYPPLSTSAGNLFAASTTFFAVATTSPSTNATAVGPSSSVSSSATPASAAARWKSVFFTIEKRACSDRERRSSVASCTDRPRYSASRRAFAPSIRSLSAATLSTFSVFGIRPP